MNQKVKLLIVVVNITLGIAMIFSAFSYSVGKYGATQTITSYRKILTVNEFNTLCQGRLGEVSDDIEHMLCSYKTYAEYARDYNSMRTGAVDIKESQRVSAKQQLPIYISLALLAVILGLINIIASFSFRKQRKWSAVYLISMNLLIFIGTASLGIEILFGFGEIYILAMALLALIWLIFEGFFVKKHWQEFN